MNHSHVAFVFPGQGSQRIGMLIEHTQKYPQVRAAFDEASQILGKDLWDLTSNGPENYLNRTENTQPILLAASIGLWRAWQASGGAIPKWLAGHSLGEYSALVCAKAMHYEDALKLVHARGKLMQAAVPEGVGAMAAVIGMDDTAINDICTLVQQNEVVAPANFNAIGQTVIAGHKQAIERFALLAKEKGAKRVLPLPVSVPSHCALMKDAAIALKQTLENTKIVTPLIPVIHNVDIQTSQHPDDIRDRLVKQLYSPVRWVETIQRIKNEGVTQTVECGPGKVLSGLIKRIDESLQTFNLDPLSDFESTLTTLG